MPGSRWLRVLLALLVAVWIFPTGPVSAAIEFEARIWAPDLSGKGLVGDFIDGTEIDLEKDLGLEAGEILEGRFTWQPMKALMFRVAYARMDLSGDARVERDFEFDGIVFPIGIQVESSLNIDYARFAAAWLFPLGEDFRIGPIVEAKGLYADASIVGRLLSLEIRRGEKDFAAGFGSAGLILDYKPIPTLHLFAEGTIDVGVSEGGATDIELGIKFFPLKLLSVSGGYRVINIEYSDDPDYAEVDLSGFFLGASVRF